MPRGGGGGGGSSSTTSRDRSNTASNFTPDIQRAIEIVRDAISADERERPAEAFPLYQEAVAVHHVDESQLFLAGLKKEDDPAKVEYLKKAANNYLTRAEELKHIIDSAPAPRPSSLSSKPTRSHGGSLNRGAKSASCILGKKGTDQRPGTIEAPPAKGGGASGSGSGGRTDDRKPDDYDYTGKSTIHKRSASVPARGLGGRRGAATSAGRGSGRGGSSSSAATTTTKPANEFEAVVMNEMLDKSPGVSWDQIAGLQDAKQMLQETVIYPNLRPDLFHGLRAPPRGVLLFGPPGTGKTLLAKAVASESGFSFFSISASSLVSRYLGDGEKMVRALFNVARQQQPSVIFIDEIDSMLSARHENEHEASRRLKTEFLVQLDGAGTDSEDRILVLGASNLPWALDEAVLRRLAKRVYIPLPDAEARDALIRSLLRAQKHDLKGQQLSRLVALTEGYSCSDLTAVCKDAALEPIRDLGSNIRTVKEDQLRPLRLDDFVKAIQRIRPSVTAQSIEVFEKWLKDQGY